MLKSRGVRRIAENSAPFRNAGGTRRSSDGKRKKLRSQKNGKWIDCPFQLRI